MGHFDKGALFRIYKVLTLPIILLYIVDCILIYHVKMHNLTLDNRYAKIHNGFSLTTCIFYKTIVISFLLWTLLAPPLGKPTGPGFIAILYST